MFSRINQLVDHLIDQLGISQQVYAPPQPTPPQPEPYPIEYDYLGRCLLSLGEHFREYKLVNLPQPTLPASISYCINPSKPPEPSNQEPNQQPHQQSSLTPAQQTELCQQLGINLIIVGPDPNGYILIPGSTTKPTHLQPYVLLYRSMEDLYYPIVTLEQKENYLYYERSSSILPKLMKSSPAGK